MKNKEQNKVPNMEQNDAPDKPEKKQQEYEIGKMYAGYMWVDDQGEMHFREKKRMKVLNALVTVFQDDDVTIQRNEKYVKVTISVQLSRLTLAYFAKVSDKIFYKLFL